VNFQNDAGFFFGAGIMGLATGLGLGSKSPNKWALLIGLAALYRANVLYPILDISPRAEFFEAFPDAPSFPSVEDVRSQVGLQFRPGLVQ
jgi:hypothetical protein